MHNCQMCVMFPIKNIANCIHLNYRRMLATTAWMFHSNITLNTAACTQFRLLSFSFALWFFEKAKNHQQKNKAPIRTRPTTTL